MSTRATAGAAIVTDVSGVATMVVEAAPDGGLARCTGSWTLRSIGALERRIHEQRWPQEGALIVDTTGIAALDSAGAWLLQRTAADLRSQGIAVSFAGLRPELDTLMRLVAARAEQVAAAAPPARHGVLHAVGRKAWEDARSAYAFLAFVGESFAVLLHSLAHPRRIRWRAVFHNMQSAGFDALPITGLLSFLMGIVIAYQGADQLQRFGANVFIADLVGIAMLRELSPLLTAIIVAGRSGSAYTAQIGTMKVTEEIDALRTVGIAPQELLVLPKLLALVIVLPLLTVYTDVAGVIGGMMMARTQLGLTFEVFLDRLKEAIVLSTYLTGLCKAPVFATIIALVGCYRGFETHGSADSVGRQTTVSVVQSIFLVIVTDAIFSVVFNLLDL
jgi:phospholipid/cholesterol/gamma-HCH transport system permease protein